MSEIETEGNEEPRRRGPEPWHPTDHRQVRVLRWLRMFGEAPAAHFSDACQMMAERNLQGTTHLVGVSLRELEGGVRGVLASMLSTDQQQAIAARRRRRDPSGLVVVRVATEPVHAPFVPPGARRVQKPVRGAL